MDAGSNNLYQARLSRVFGHLSVGGLFSKKRKSFDLDDTELTDGRKKTVGRQLRIIQVAS